MRNFVVVMALTFGMMFNSYAQESIKWLSFEEAVDMNKKTPKKFFIDFYTSWCGWCKRLDAVTFLDPEVVDLLNKHYYAVKFDAEQKEPIAFGDKSYEFVMPPNSRRGYHELAATIMQGKMSYPTMVILEVDETASKVMILTPIAGYVEGEKLEPILEYLGKDLHLKQVDWESYRTKYAGGTGGE